MLTALEIVALITMIVLSACAVLSAVRSRQTSSDAFLMLDRAHDRWVKHTENLHDRLMAKDWNQYVEMVALKEPGDDTGFFTPDEQEPPEEEEEVEQLMPKGWGSLHVARDMPRPDASEERLLAEDFDEDGEAVTDEQRRYKQAQEHGVV